LSAANSQGAETQGEEEQTRDLTEMEEDLSFQLVCSVEDQVERVEDTALGICEFFAKYDQRPRFLREIFSQKLLKLQLEDIAQEKMGLAKSGLAIDLPTVV
jgi:hypothetical protein